MSSFLRAPESLSACNSNHFIWSDSVPHWFLFGSSGNVPSLQVKCKPLPNGKIAPASKHKAGAISRKSSTEEKERGRDKEREKEESNDKEEKKEEDASEEGRAEEQAFLVDLYKYMKDRDTPIERIPFLGFKQSEYAFFLLPPAADARAEAAPPVLGPLLCAI